MDEEDDDLDFLDIYRDLTKIRDNLYLGNYYPVIIYYFI
jgi:hypothetical protein